MMDNASLESQSNKRLVLCLSNFPQLSETFIVSKFLGLLQYGWDVHIVCNHIDKETWLQFPELVTNPEAKRRVHHTWPIQPRLLAVLLFPWVMITCLLPAPAVTWRYLLKGWRLFGWDVLRRLYLDAVIIRLRPDVLHFEFGTLAVGRSYLKELLGVKLSVSFRGYDLNYIGLDQPDYYHEVWETIDGAHFLGVDLWQRAQKRGAPQVLTHVLIPPALDLTSFPKPVSIDSGKKGTSDQLLKILSVGRLHWKKGYEYNLEAVRKLIDLGVHCEYKIIGDGEYINALYFARTQLNLEDSVIFCGGVPHHDVIAELSQADIFLHGAISEGFCNAVLEAQAMGLPVVCTDSDGLRENIEDGVTGFLVPRRNPVAMVEKLALLAWDGGLRKRMGNAGRKRIETLFQLDQQLYAFKDFYEQL